MGYAVDEVRRRVQTRQEKIRLLRIQPPKGKGLDAEGAGAEAFCLRQGGEQVGDGRFTQLKTRSPRLCKQEY